MYKLQNYKQGDTFLHFRPATPELQGNGLMKDLSVNGSWEYRWTTDCLSIDIKDDGVNVKYHTWHHRDKYDEGLEKKFTVYIKNDIRIEFDETKISIPLDWLHTTLETDVPPMPELLKPLIYDHFSYATMNLGKNIYLALCQIYKHKKALNL